MCIHSIIRGMDAVKEYLPFVMAVGDKRRPRVNGKEVIQSLIQSAVIGGVMLYGMVQVLDNKTGAMSKQIDQLTVEVTVLREQVTLLRIKFRE